MALPRASVFRRWHRTRCDWGGEKAACGTVAGGAERGHKRYGVLCRDRRGAPVANVNASVPTNAHAARRRRCLLRRRRGCCHGCCHCRRGDGGRRRQRDACSFGPRRFCAGRDGALEHRKHAVSCSFVHRPCKCRDDHIPGLQHLDELLDARRRFGAHARLLAHFPAQRITLLCQRIARPRLARRCLPSQSPHVAAAAAPRTQRRKAATVFTFTLEVWLAAR